MASVSESAFPSPPTSIPALERKLARATTPHAPSSNPSPASFSSPSSSSTKPSSGSGSESTSSVEVVVRCAITVAIGVGMTQQGATNLLLSPYLGSALFASFVSFLGGTIFILLMVLTRRLYRQWKKQHRKDVGENDHVPLVVIKEVDVPLPILSFYTAEDPSPSATASATTAADLMIASSPAPPTTSALPPVKLPASSRPLSPPIPLWMYSGGVLGAVYVAGTIFSALSIGLAISFSVAVGGQLFSAAAVDHFAILSTPRRHLTALRAVSLLVATAGCVLSVVERVEGGDVGAAVGFSLVSFLCGTILPFQISMNRLLAHRAFKGDMLLSATVSFAVGTLTLGIASAIMSGVMVGMYNMNVWRVSSASPWMYTGGLYGVLYVYGTILNAPVVGMARLVMCVVLGQLASSLVYDNFGLLGIAKNPATPLRIVGVMLVLIGAVASNLPVAAAVRRLSVAVSPRLSAIMTSIRGSKKKAKPPGEGVIAI